MVVALKVWVAWPAGTRRLAGTVTDGSELLNEMVVPPVGAEELSVTVPVEPVPPVTDEGEKLREERLTCTLV
jgi:hypothetical protein